MERIETNKKEGNFGNSLGKGYTSVIKSKTNKTPRRQCPTIFCCCLFFFFFNFFPFPSFQDGKIKSIDTSLDRLCVHGYFYTLCKLMQTF